jgi:hypothetical protein
LSHLLRFTDLGIADFSFASQQFKIIRSFCH